MSTKVEVRVEFEGEFADKFLFVKRDLGLKNNTEVVRHLIKEAYEKIKSETQEVAASCS
ncbi:MAG: hypothetical protein QXQ43_06770 [Nitrososphaerota archaeon]